MSTPRIKICGITRVEDAEHAARAGADFLGLNFWPRSKRYVSIETAAALAAAARKVNRHVEIVGLFVDPTEDEVHLVRHEVDLDVVQLHGDESNELCKQLGTYFDVWKAHAVTGPETIAGLNRWLADPLLDAPSAGRGGSGTTFD